MFISPLNISVEYDWVLSRSFFAPDCIFPFLGLATIGLTIFRILYTQPTDVLCFGALWFFACIAPRSSIIPSPELLVDYKTYTASIGWLFILAVGIIKLVEWLTARAPEAYAQLKTRQARILLASLIAVPLCFLTMQRNNVWRSGTEFWDNVIKNAPGKARAYNNYGVELSQIYKEYEKAIPYFKKAISMDSNYPDPCNNLAVCYSHIGNIDGAIEALKKGLHINPYYPEGYNNLASFFLRKKEYEKAAKALRTALHLRPYYGKAYFNLGRLYAEQGKQEQCLECFKKACTIADLDNEFGFTTYGNACFQQKKFDQAIWAFGKVLEYNPNNMDALFNLGNTYYLAKQYDHAKTIYQRMIQIRPDDIRVWYNLGETLFAQNKIDEALNCFKRVEPHKEELPNVLIRLAGCHEKKGDPVAAHKLLEQAVRGKRVPTQMKIKARQLLVQLEQHYPQTQVVT